MIASVVATVRERVPGQESAGQGMLRACKRQRRLWSKATQISTHRESDVGLQLGLEDDCIRVETQPLPFSSEPKLSPQSDAQGEAGPAAAPAPLCRMIALNQRVWAEVPWCLLPSGAWLP